MKLIEVTLVDILAYRGTTTVDLSRADGDRNMVLIWGRNGKGKTSFITALKMLFAGIADERIRTIGFPPRPLPEGQFVRGDGEHWIGVVNRQAAVAAARREESVTASISAVIAHEGVELQIRRAWTVMPIGTYVEHVEVTDPDGRLTDQAARERLADILPPDYVEFFFFDGEDIKSLAETAERKNIDFDKLLRITFVTELVEELRNLATERRRKTLDQRERERLRELQRDLDDNIFVENEAARELTRIGEELRGADADLRRLQAVRENLSSGASEAQRAALEQRRNTLRTDLWAANAEIAASMPVDAPLVANLPLVATALAALNARLDAAGAAEQGLIRRVREGLPGWVSTAVPELDDATRDRLVAALDWEVARLSSVEDDTGIFADLDIGRAERVRTQLLRFVAAGSVLRSSRAGRLMDVSRMQLELAVLDDDLMRLEVGSQANIERYRSVVTEIESLEEAIGQLNQRKGQQSARRAGAQETIERLKHELRDVERRSKRADQDAEDALRIEAIARTLSEVRERMRAAARARVAELLNTHFRTLVFDHALIGKIEIDDSYTLVFLDDEGRRIGRASLSSGLKQLAATALLWAMKDAAGYDMPVVIDTPLGRIDRENQDNMLINYYPRLSHQVVLLPTNAEVDSRKKALLAAHVADEWLIENEGGDNATMARGMLVRV